MSPASPGVPALAPGVNPGVSNFPGSNSATGAPAELRQKPIVLPGPDAGANSGNRNPSGNLAEPKLESRTEPTSSAPRLINPGDRTTRRSGNRVTYAVQRTTAEEPAGSNYRQIAWPRDTVAGPAQAEAKTDPRQARPAPASDRKVTQDDDGWRPSKR
jgi:hypothetical protein